MSEPPGPKPRGARWHRVADLPPGAEDWGVAYYRERVGQWREVQRELDDRKVSRYLLDIRLRERFRLFAIETGQIEGLYFLRRGVTEQLVTEGFDGVRAADSFGGDLDDDTLRGLLEDQEETLRTVFDMAKDGTPLSHTTIKRLHAAVTRHQDTATGIHALTGERVRIPLRKGDYKIRPNNPRRRDGHVHEYCPPDQVDSEMDRFLEFHRSHADRELPTEVEAAWLHHAFVRIHPFQDGNGRVSRLLMAYAFARNGELPPVIPTYEKDSYLRRLDEADEGYLHPFIKYLAIRSLQDTAAAVGLAKSILRGRTHLRHGNGGLTSNGRYYPPRPDPV